MFPSLKASSEGTNTTCLFFTVLVCKGFQLLSLEISLHCSYVGTPFLSDLCLDVAHEMRLYFSFPTFSIILRDPFCFSNSVNYGKTFVLDPVPASVNIVSAQIFPNKKDERGTDKPGV